MTKTILISLIFFLSQPTWAEAIDLAKLLSLATNQSQTLKASDLELQSIEPLIKGRDSLVTTLSLEAVHYRDEREATTQLGPSQSLGASLSRPFFTGTDLQLDLSYDLLNRKSSQENEATADWQITLTQSLWKNSFGRSYRLQDQSDIYEIENAKATALLKKQNLLRSLEELYWNILSGEKERAIQIENIKRSENLVKWTQNRVNRFAAEKTDLLQVQTLLLQRKMDLSKVENQLEIYKKELATYFPNQDTASWIFDTKDLTTLRKFEDSGKKPIRLDSLAAINKAMYDQKQAELTDDSLNPDLSLFYTYGANGMDSEFDPAWDRAKQGEFSQEKVGVSLSMVLDPSVIKNQRSAAVLRAQASQLKADALKLESAASWDSLNQSIKILQDQIKMAEDLVNLQKSKLNIERNRYQQGRTSTLQMISFEVDATASELRLYGLLTQLRKAEAEIRLYTRESSHELN